MVDALVSSQDLESTAIAAIRAEQESGDYLRDRERLSNAVSLAENELDSVERNMLTMLAEQPLHQRTTSKATADLLLETATMDAMTACQQETTTIASLFGSPENIALMNVFFLADYNKKDRRFELAKRYGETRQDNTNSLGIVGAGIMGIGIAVASVQREIEVLISDANPGAASNAIREVVAEVDNRFATFVRIPDCVVGPSPPTGQSSTDAPDELGECDIIIESIIENAEIKRQVFQALEPQLSEQAVLATNTSTIQLSQLAPCLENPERFCGIHFCNPVRERKLVEIVRGEKTNDATIAKAFAYARKIGQLPIVVNDGPGFLVNRLLFPYLNEALELLCEGASPQAIEQAAMDFGLSLGPLAAYDLIGIDTSFYAGRVMWEAFPDRIVPSPILNRLIKKKRLGRKSGAGFFAYPNGQDKPEPDTALDAIIDPYIRKKRELRAVGNSCSDRSSLEFEPSEIQDRLLLPMVLEATRALDEGIVRNARDADIGMIFGLAFPRHRGGLLHWADTLGAAEIVERLKPLEQLGKRMEPTEMLLDMAESGRKFYTDP